MADRRRIVTFSSGGRPVLDIDLEVTTTYQAIQDTFQYAPGQQNQLVSSEQNRYGGGTVVGETNDNGTVTWQALVQSTSTQSVDRVAQNIEALLASGAKTTKTRLLEWRPDGATYSSYFRIAGPITWAPTYSWKQLNGAQSMVVTITVPVRPLVLWDPMTILDLFSVDSRGDYTFDAATSADVTITGGSLGTTGAAVTVERRARHTARGYDLLEGYATLLTSPGAANLNGQKAGVIMRASASNTYVEVYVDDNGTNSRLRIDTVVAGVRTNKNSVNLASRLGVASVLVRGRIEGNVVTAEFFNGSIAPGPQDTPTNTITYTLVSGDGAVLTTAGKFGWSWIPANASSAITFFTVQPYCKHGLTIPSGGVIPWLDAIPGNAPALADIGVTTSASALWGLLAWTQHQTSQGPVGLFDDSAAALTGAAASASDGNAHLGANTTKTTVAGVQTFRLSWSPSLGLVQADEFSDNTVDLEIWARVIVSSDSVTPKLTASIRPLGAGSSEGERFTQEYGSAGKLLSIPSAGTVYRKVRLGTITADADPSIGLGVITVKADVAGGAIGHFGLDYVEVVPARRRASGITGVPSTQVATFQPAAIASPIVAAFMKLIHSDLSGALVLVPGVIGSQILGGAHQGLGGAPLQIQPGLTDLVVALHDAVPDDPTVNAASDATTYTASVLMNIIPRSSMLRPS